MIGAFGRSFSLHYPSVSGHLCFGCGWKPRYEIAIYLREGNFEQVIISHTGGASFRLTDIYEEVLVKKTVDAIKESAQQHMQPTKTPRRRTVKAK